VRGVWTEAAAAAALIAVDPLLGGAVVRARPGPVRDGWLDLLRGLLPPEAPWRRLPPGVDDDRLLGGLDLAAALGAGRRVLQPGLLSEADGGVVVAPMAERLEEGLAARLAAALDEGAVALERDGLARRLPARFTLIALDEGAEPDERPPAVLLERLAFRLDLAGVSYRELEPSGLTAEDVARARAALPAIAPVPAEATEAMCAAAEALGVDSLRAPLLALRLARALAALSGRSAVEPDDLAAAARWVLASRATRVPAAASEEEPEAPVEDASPPEQEGPESDLDQARLDEIVLEAAQAALPPELQALWAAQGAQPSGRASAGGSKAAARLPRARRGRIVGVRPGKPREARALDLAATLKAAAPWRRLRPPPRAGGPLLAIRSDDLRVRRFEPRGDSTVIIAVDASGSAALHRLAEAKGAVELLLSEAYVRRTEVALIAFRGAGAELLLPPTRSLTRARRRLAELAGGGATPLAAALEAAGSLAAAERAKGRRPLLVLLTDGRANVALDGAGFRTRAETDALAAARRIAAAGVASALIDTSPRPRGEGARLAQAMGARFSTLPYLDAEAVRATARALAAAA